MKTLKEALTDIQFILGVCIILTLAAVFALTCDVNIAFLILSLLLAIGGLRFWIWVLRDQKETQNAL